MADEALEIAGMLRADGYELRRRDIVTNPGRVVLDVVKDGQPVGFAVLVGTYAN